MKLVERRGRSEEEGGRLALGFKGGEAGCLVGGEAGVRPVSVVPYSQLMAK